MDLRRLMADADFRDCIGAPIEVSQDLEEAKPKAGSPRQQTDDGGKRTVRGI
jgi:hypothetical protein